MPNSESKSVKPKQRNAKENPESQKKLLKLINNNANQCYGKWKSASDTNINENTNIDKYI